MAEMKEQPFWIDMSSWQGQIDFDKIAALTGFDYVHGIFTRAGWGEDGGYIDQTFNRNWNEIKRIGRYRSSYWAYWDYFPLQHQLDLWYRANPEIDFIPRMWDMEVEHNTAEWLSEQTWLASEKVKERDGHRFIIYTRNGILERTLLKYWTPEMLNAHYYMLAQYDENIKGKPETYGEYNGINVPKYPDGSYAIDPQRILLKQTTSLMELWPGSGKVDRDRWIWTDAPAMEDQITEMWGAPDPTPDPEPEPGCNCEQLRIDIDKNAENLQLLSDMVTAGDKSLEEANKAIDTLSADYILLADKVEKLRVKQNIDIAALNKRVDGLAGGHDHPVWIKNLGWAYPVVPKEDDEE